MKKAKKRLIITSLLITILIVSFLFSGCSTVSKYAKSKSEKASGESAVVDYTCVSKPKSEKKIYVILKNYHGDYWKTVIEGIELSLIHISEPTRRNLVSRMPSSA